MKRLQQDKIIKDNKKSRPLQLRAKKLFENDDSDSDMDLDMISNDDLDDFISDCEDLTTSCVDMKGVEEVVKDDCVLCEYIVKKSVLFYVAVVRKEVDEDGDVEVEFLRKSEKVTGKFIRPHVEDIACVPIKDIKCKLTKLEKSGTARTKDVFFFKENLSYLNVK